MENNFKEILNQIQSDLSDLQNNPDGLSYEQLEKFYDRVCSSVTQYESVEKQKRDFNKYFHAYMKQQIKNDYENSLGLSF
jgi:DNA repair exonuclease SbcCD ATPase subunit